MKKFVGNDWFIDDSKVSDYLLSVQHRVGGAKARFFLSLGFSQSRCAEFSEALKRHALENEIKNREVSEYGTKIIIEGPLQCPDGRLPIIRTVWIIDAGVIFPRLVTAYPVD